MSKPPRPATRHIKIAVALLMGIGIGVALDRIVPSGESPGSGTHIVRPRERGAGAEPIICQKDIFTSRCLSDLLESIAEMDRRNQGSRTCGGRYDEAHLLELVYKEREELADTAAYYLDDEWGNARMSAVYILGQLGTDHAVNILLDHLELEERRPCIETHLLPWHQWPAADALRRIGPRAAELAVYRLSTSWWVSENYRNLVFRVLRSVHGSTEGAHILERSGERAENIYHRVNLAVATVLFRQQTLEYLQQERENSRPPWEEPEGSQGKVK